MDKSRRKLVGAAGAALVSVPTAVHCVGTAAVADLDRNTAAPGQVLTFVWNASAIEPLPGQTNGPLIATIGQLQTDGQLQTGGEVNTTRTTIASNDGRRVEQQVFMVPDGQLIGAGSVIDGLGSFAILGGTGRFRGAGGEYRVSYDSTDGLGTATFAFEMTTKTD